MTDQDYTADDLNQQLYTFLHAEARRNHSATHPLTFKYDGKGKLTDQHKRTFEIDMGQLESFKDHFTDKAYKWIRLHSWNFELSFQGKACQQISLTAQYVTLIASKSQTKNIKDCPFRIIVAKEEDIQALAPNFKGYLNRIGKRNLVYSSDNVSAEIPTLISFLKSYRRVQPIEKFAMIPQATEQQLDPQNLVNKEGTKILEKLRHFVSRQNLLSFMYDQELSEQGARKMRRLIFPEPVNQGKKIFAKNIIETLQRNVIE